MERIINKLKDLPLSITGHFVEEHIPLVQEVLAITKPRFILEFGFNVGHSAVLWLELSQANLISYDISTEEFTTYAGANRVKAWYLDRFTFINKSSGRAKYDQPIGQFDLIFIDGDHSKDGLLRDIDTATYLLAPYILIDDYNDRGLIKETVSKATQDYPYTVIKTLHIENTNCDLALLKRE